MIAQAIHWVRRRSARAVVTFALLTALGSPCALAAQASDSPVTLLDSPNVRDRSDGVEMLLAMPVSSWPAGARELIVQLLNSEGEALLEADASGDSPDETSGGYHIALVRAALLLNDPASLRGMVTLGMQVSGRATQFVVSRGAEALPELQHAYAGGDIALRIRVVNALGILLLSDRLQDSVDRQTAYAMLLNATGYELSFLRNAGQFPEFAGAVEWTADSSPDDVERESAQRVVANFTRHIGDYSALDLWRKELQLLDATCLDGARAHCESLPNVGSTVEAQIDAQRWGPARNALNAFIQQLNQSCSRAQMTPAACRILKPNAQRVLTKLSE